MTDRRPAGDRRPAAKRSDNGSPKAAKKPPEGPSGSGPAQVRAAREAYEALARQRVDEGISGPLVALWSDWDRAWTELVGELIDGEGDGFLAAGAALADVGRVVVRVDEFRGRDLSDLLVANVPNLLANCPPLPAPGRVLDRLRAMASDTHFHTPAPPRAAELIVTAADGTTVDLLAQQLAEVAASARLRETFVWFAFIRDRLLPPPGPPRADGAYTRTEAAPGVAVPDLHDLGRAEGLLPGRLGGHIEVEVEEAVAVPGLDDGAGVEPDREPTSVAPLEPWNLGTFAARVRVLAARLRVWHENPFEPPLRTLAAGEPAVAATNRQPFQDAARPFTGRPEPVRHSAADAGGSAEDDRTADRDFTLWLLAEVERQLANAMSGTAWDYLRGLFENLLARPAWAAIVPTHDTPTLAFLAQRERLVVAGRQVDEALLRGLEDAAERLLVVAPGQGTVTTVAGVATGKKRKMGRPPLSPEEAKRKKTIYLGWKASELTKEEYLEGRGMRDPQDLLDLESGRKLVAEEAKRAGKKSAE